MAALDNLLRAGLRHKMEALVFVPGQLPVLRAGGTERGVTQTPLDAARIELMVRELAPAGTGVAAGSPFQFRIRARRRAAPAGGRDRGRRLESDRESLDSGRGRARGAGARRGAGDDPSRAGA